MLQWAFCILLSLTLFCIVLFESFLKRNHQLNVDLGYSRDWITCNRLWWFTFHDKILFWWVLSSEHIVIFIIACLPSHGVDITDLSYTTPMTSQCILIQYCWNNVRKFCIQYAYEKLCKDKKNGVIIYYFYATHKPWEILHLRTCILKYRVSIEFSKV